MIRYKHIVSPIQLKQWKNQAISSNVDRINYEDETKELVVKFNDGDIYTYFDVDFAEFLDLINGAGICRTTGSNEYGSWYLGKYPSVGAALYRILVRRGKTYKKGGKI
jgi:hypothetical protein